MTEKVKMHKLNDGTIDDIQPDEIFDEDGNVIPGREYLNTWKLQTGYTAMGIHGTWNLTGLINVPKENNDTKMGFWPYPSGPAGSFPPVILDYQCVSSQTSFPEEAYLLAKWMTYGKEGWETRMDIYDEAYQASLEKRLPTLIDRFPLPIMRKFGSESWLTWMTSRVCRKSSPIWKTPNPTWTNGSPDTRISGPG